MIFVDISVFSNVLVKNFSCCSTAYFALLRLYLSTFMVNKVDHSIEQSHKTSFYQFKIMAICIKWQIYNFVRREPKDHTRVGWEDDSELRKNTVNSKSLPHACPGHVFLQVFLHFVWYSLLMAPSSTRNTFLEGTCSWPTPTPP